MESGGREQKKLVPVWSFVIADGERVVGGMMEVFEELRVVQKMVEVVEGGRRVERVLFVQIDCFVQT